MYDFCESSRDKINRFKGRGGKGKRGVHVRKDPPTTTSAYWLKGVDNTHNYAEEEYWKRNKSIARFRESRFDHQHIEENL
jgi:hypothetical protein